MKTIKGKTNYFLINELYPYKIAISLKSPLVNSGDMSDNFIENEDNRKLLFNTLGIENKKIIHNKQIHSNKIINVEIWNKNKADGLYSDNFDYAMYIITADCYNIFFVTNNGKKFGIVHAGWQGIINGIIEKLSNLLENKSKIVIGQGICRKHFIVEKDVMIQFEKRFSNKFIEQINEKKFAIDLRKIIHNILMEKADIINLNLCNVCNHNKLFSYRKNDKLNRNMSIIWR